MGKKKKDKDTTPAAREGAYTGHRTRDAGNRTPAPKGKPIARPKGD